MKRNRHQVKSLDDAARLAGGYVNPSAPSLDHDKLIREALAKRKAIHEKVRS